MENPIPDVSAALVAALTTLEPLDHLPPLMTIHDMINTTITAATIEEVLSSPAIWEYIECVKYNKQDEIPTLSVIRRALEISPVPVLDSNDLPDGW